MARFARTVFRNQTLLIFAIYELYRFREKNQKTQSVFLPLSSR